MVEVQQRREPGARTGMARIRSALRLAQIGSDLYERELAWKRCRGSQTSPSIRRVGAAETRPADKTRPQLKADPADKTTADCHGGGLRGVKRGQGGERRAARVNSTPNCGTRTRLFHIRGRLLQE